jgi:predicted glutamine amidotransferase
MCRLFGMSGGSNRVAATFWLLDASDSLAKQSYREPDGTGLGWYDEHDAPQIVKQPFAAHADKVFASEAKEVRSRTFVAHIRYASTGGLKPENTHPFEMQGRLFAHNGVIADLPTLEHELGPELMQTVQGDTDSERFFALITREIDTNHGDVAAGITSAAKWVAENLPVFALNIVLITATDVWALRYPDTHELYVLERTAGGCSGDRHLEHASARGTIRVRCGELAKLPAVMVASEPMDEDSDWVALEPGELLHVSSDLRATRTTALPDPPEHLLTLADLDPRAAASQAPTTMA